MRALIATDGSSASLEAARSAFALLGRDAELVLITVVELEDPAEDAGGIEGPVVTVDQARAHNQETLVAAHAALAATARALGTEPIEQHLAQGRAGQVICRRARELEADVVVVGPRRRSGLARRLLGSVSSYVVNHCDLPVLVARTPSDAGAADGAPAQPS